MYKYPVLEIYYETITYFVHLKVDRTGTKVTVVEQKERKDYSFQQIILELCLDCLEKGVVPSPEVNLHKMKNIEI